LYIGGGTPSLWGSDGAQFLYDEVVKRYSLDPDCEFTIEVDPDSWSSDDIQNWISIGVNRFSIGAQSFDDEFLKTMDRNHNKKQIIDLITYLKSIEANYSVDIMLGLPANGFNRDVISELKEFIQYDPSHFSVYILKTRANYIHKNKLPNDDDTATEYTSVCNFLESNNYKQYEVSNFAKDAKESKHNLRYWSCDSVAALGPNATGLLNFESTATRYQWKSSGTGNTEESLNTEDFLLESIYMGLRSRLGYDFADLKSNQLDSCFSSWRDLGYIQKIENYHVYLNNNGYLMLDSIIDNLFSNKII
jgi:oxygen-independent coproporphyrinogen-3 oxidase